MEFDRRQKAKPFADYNRSMRGRCILVAVLWQIVAIAAGSAAFGDSEPRYVTFTIKDRHDIYVRDLALEEVKITLDGKPADVRFLAGKEIETAFLVLLENSPRTAKYPVSVPQWGEVNPIDVFRYHMQYDFFPLLTTMGSVALGEFYKEIKLLQDFTDLKGRLSNTYTAGFYVDTTGRVEEHELKVEVAREKSKVTHRKYLVY